VKVPLITRVEALPGIHVRNTTYEIGNQCMEPLEREKGGEGNALIHFV
jgi:hypothetical protein